MKEYGEWLSLTISAGEYVSSSVNLGKDFEFINVIIPQVANGFLHVKVSETIVGTYSGSILITYVKRCHADSISYAEMAEISSW